MDARFAPAIGRRDKAASRPPMLALALGAGLLTASLAYFALQSLAAHPSPAAQTIPNRAIVVAGRDIPARTVLTQNLLQTRTVAANSVPEGTASAPFELVGQVTTVAISAGSPIAHQMAAPRDINMGMAYAIPPSMRAVAIPLDPVSGVAGFARPGDHVDVLATFTEAENRAVTRTILQNVTLLATGTRVISGFSRAETGQKATGTNPETGQNVPARPEEMPNATLMVHMEDTPRLVLAAAKGKLQLILRPADDPSHTALPGTASIGVVTESSSKAAQMRGLQQAAPAQTFAPRPYVPAAPSPGAQAAAPKTDAAPPHLAKLVGVIAGHNACATIALDDRSYLAQVGETLFGYKITRIFDTGVLVSAGKRKAAPWLVGGSRPVSDAISGMTAKNDNPPVAADNTRPLPDI